MSDTSMVNTSPSADAWAQLQQILNQYGLGSLSDFAKQQIVQGNSNDQVLLNIRQTPQWKQTYGVITQAQAKGLQPLSENDVLALRKGYQDATGSVGIDTGFLSQDQMDQMVLNGKSPTELQTQLQNTYQKLQNDPTLAPQLERLYGMGMTPGEQAAFFLDPTHTEAYMEQKTAAATMAARSQAIGFGELDKTTAEHLAGMGISDAQAATGFGNLAAQNPLFTQNASEGNSIDKSVGIGAEFDKNAADQALLTQRRAERQASFSGGGNFADPNKSGLTGAGASNT